MILIFWSLDFIYNIFLFSLFRGSPPKGELNEVLNAEQLMAATPLSPIHESDLEAEAVSSRPAAATKNNEKEQEILKLQDLEAADVEELEHSKIILDGFSSPPRYCSPPFVACLS